jgi:hypothetical protein
MPPVLTLLFTVIAAVGLLVFAWELISGQALDQRGRVYATRQKSPLVYWVSMLVVGLFLCAAIWFGTARQAVNFPMLFGAVMAPLATATPVARPCQMALDSTYGYTPENPVRVGGGDAEGLQRAQTYLRALSTMDGALVKFERRGYVLSGGASLDFFALTEAAVETLVYFDYESYVEPQALAGYTCTAPLSGGP